MSSSIFTISSVIDHSLLQGSARERAIDAMYRDSFGIIRAEEYAGYASSSSALGARTWELSDPRDYSAMNDAARGDYEILVNHADLIISRYGREALRSQAESLYRRAMGE